MCVCVCQFKCAFAYCSFLTNPIFVLCLIHWHWIIDVNVSRVSRVPFHVSRCEFRTKISIHTHSLRIETANSLRTEPMNYAPHRITFQMSFLVVVEETKKCGNWYFSRLQFFFLALSRSPDTKTIHRCRHLKVMQKRHSARDNSDLKLNSQSLCHRLGRAGNNRNKYRIANVEQQQQQQQQKEHSLCQKKVISNNHHNFLSLSLLLKYTHNINIPKTARYVNA